MGRDNRRKRGWWLPVGIGLILTMALVRALSSRGWIPNVWGDRNPTYQTISSGASVQVGTTSSSVAGQNLKPSTPPAQNPDPPKKMW